jgi:hypothetical protein
LILIGTPVRPTTSKPLSSLVQKLLPPRIRTWFQLAAETSR